MLLFYKKEKRYRIYQRDLRLLQIIHLQLAAS